MSVFIPVPCCLGYYSPVVLRSGTVMTPALRDSSLHILHHMHLLPLIVQPAMVHLPLNMPEMSSISSPEDVQENSLLLKNLCDLIIQPPL
jgi:hypothetical protein